MKNKLPRDITLNITDIKNAIDDLATLQFAYEDHIRQFLHFRRNIVNRFFGGSIDSIDIKLSDIKTFIDGIKTTHDAFFGKPAVVHMKLSWINTKLPEIERRLARVDSDIGYIKDGELVSNIISDIILSMDEIKKTHESIKDDFPRIITAVEKIKMSHDLENINNVVYTTQHGLLNWTSENNILNITATIKEIYRLKIVSQYHFDIFPYGDNIGESFDNVISKFIKSGETKAFTITPNHDKNKEEMYWSSITWYVELVVDLNK